MTGKNSTRMVGWHPSADHVAWLEAEIERRGGCRGVQSTILDEALSEYREHIKKFLAVPRKAGRKPKEQQ